MKNHQFLIIVSVIAFTMIFFTGCEELIEGNDPPNPPTLPVPQDKATDQSINTTLNWTATDPNNDPLVFDVYFGLDNPPPMVIGGISTTTYAPGVLEYDTTYYWRIVARDDSDEEFSSSKWSFSTEEDPGGGGSGAPNQPELIGPEHMGTGIGDCALLLWTCTDPDGDALTFDIYFGTTSPPILVKENENDEEYDPGSLELNTQYFWKVVAKDGDDNTTEGPQWSFTTRNIVNEGPCNGTATISDADGNVYPTIQIGSQCWMAENMRVGATVISWDDMADNGTIERFCYYHNDDTCEVFGAYYTWHEMMQYSTQSGAQGICPDGWHIPTDQEVKILEGFVDCRYGIGDPVWDETMWRGENASHMLRSVDMWIDNVVATNPFGFDLRPAGTRSTTGFYSKRSAAVIWTSDGEGEDAWSRTFVHYSDIRREKWNKADEAFSVRCLKN